MAKRILVMIDENKKTVSILSDEGRLFEATAEKELILSD